MIERMGYMTDYVFWNAFVANNPQRIFDGARLELGPEELGSDQFRIEIALRFLERRIVKRFDDIFRKQIRLKKPYSHSLLSDHLETYVRLFGSQLVPIRIAEEIWNFTSKGKDLPQPFKDEVARRVGRVRAIAEAPFAEAKQLDLLLSPSV